MLSITVLSVVVHLEVGRRRNSEALEEADVHHLDGDAELLLRILVNQSFHDLSPFLQAVESPADLAASVTKGD